MHGTRWTLGLVAALGAAGALAQEPIVIGHTATLPSAVLDEERTVFVHVPDGYETGDERYPVLYLLDARAHFIHTVGVLRNLARNGRVPEMIVVGITNTDRTRDLTPRWTTPDVPEGWEQTVPQSGGADAFLRFLTEELRPFVEERYRTTPLRVLVGHSFGGLFALHALLTRPEAFHGVVAISPSMHWDVDLPLRELAALLADPPAAPRFLSLAIGDEGGEMRDHYHRFVERLTYDAPATLVWRSRVFDDDDHGTVPLRATYHGLRDLFPLWRLPQARVAEGMAGVERHYAELSATYGHAIPVPEAVLNNLGYRLLGQGEHDEAIAVLRANVERHPESANVYDSLGEALEAAGREREALARYREAVARGRRSEDPNLHFYEQHLEQLEERLADGD